MLTRKLITSEAVCNRCSCKLQLANNCNNFEVPRLILYHLVLRNTL